MTKGREHPFCSRGLFFFLLRGREPGHEGQPRGSTLQQPVLTSAVRSKHGWEEEEEEESGC